MSIDTIAPIWFSPICDMALARLQVWDAYYEHAPSYTLSLPLVGQKRSMPFTVKTEVMSTRKFMDGVNVIDKPTAYVHWLPWTLVELNHLVRVVSCIRPKSVQEEIVKKMRDLWTNPNGTLLSGGYKVLELPFYQGAIKSLIEILLEAKNQSKQQVSKQKPLPNRPGKDLFEM